MELSEIKKKLEIMHNEAENFGKSLDLEALDGQIAENEYEMSQPDFWNDNQTAQKVIDETNQLKKRRDDYTNLIDSLDNVKMTVELLEEENDEELQNELENDVTTVTQKLEKYRLAQLLNEPYDKNNAILEIHPGSGGTESADWGQNLFRMYTRWAEQHGFNVEVMDYQADDVAGISAVTMAIKGYNAYGYLRSEKGVHRFVRISPFDSAGRRHTSFVSIDVMPEIDDSIEVDVSWDDIKMDVFRASGAGGQHINKTSSAVRLTHIPTGIVVSSQAQRSQFQNKDTALAMLKSKLYQLELEKKEKERAEIAGEQMENGWGSQIRSYVFHPYSMVKDHRTNFETSNPQAVMDGSIDPFIMAYLQWKLSLKNPD